MQHSVPKLIQKLFPNRVWEMPRADDSIFITFDDGPVPGVTEFVLDELERRGQRATFFMVGENVRKHPQLAEKVIAAGHQVGNHTQHHLNGWKTGFLAYQQDIQLCDETLEGILGVKTCLFRPPYGLMTPRQASAVERDKTIVMWSLLTRDYDKRLDSSVILDQAKRLSKPGRVVVFHDQEKTRSVLRKLLPDFLDYIEDQGLQSAVL